MPSLAHGLRLVRGAGLLEPSQGKDRNMFGIGEYDQARARVASRHGEAWATWLDDHRQAIEYGPTFSRVIADNVSKVFHALAKGEPTSADYWREVTDTCAMNARDARLFAERRAARQLA